MPLPYISGMVSPTAPGSGSAPMGTLYPWHDDRLERKGFNVIRIG
jgi:hypothetical protein